MPFLSLFCFVITGNKVEHLVCPKERAQAEQFSFCIKTTFLIIIQYTGHCHWQYVIRSDVMIWSRQIKNTYGIYWFVWVVIMWNIVITTLLLITVIIISTSLLMQLWFSFLLISTSVCVCVYVVVNFCFSFVLGYGNINVC